MVKAAVISSTVVDSSGNYVTTEQEPPLYVGLRCSGGLAEARGSVFYLVATGTLEETGGQSVALKGVKPVEASLNFTPTCTP